MSDVFDFNGDHLWRFCRSSLLLVLCYHVYEGLTVIRDILLYRFHIWLTLSPY
jgi:hypothetical protein